VRFEFHDVVDAGPDAVFAIIADVPRKHEWVSEVVASRLTSDGPLGPGTTFEDTVRFLGRTSVVPTAFTEFDPPRKIVYRHLGGPIRAELRYAMAPVDAGTELTVSIDAELPGYLRPLTPILRGVMSRQMAGNFTALKRMVRRAQLTASGSID